MFKLLLLFLTLTNCFSADLIVNTTHGPIKGFFNAEKNLDQWFGIKFGKQPERFQSPESVDPWTEVKEATQFGANCMQASDRDYFNVTQNSLSEDCLYLNIWRPAQIPKEEKLPVLLFIFGGGFVFGGSSYPQIHGDTLAQKGVIFASLNYRVGPLGFMPRDNKGSGGMNGIADQILGLKWLHNNLERFGGDQNKITIFGLSSGSISTCLLSASPLTKGLIQGAILESGACTGSIYEPNSPKDGALRRKRFLKAFGVKSLDQLKDIPASKLAKWPDNVKGTIKIWWGSDVMPEQPSEWFKKRENVHTKNFIIGDTSVDGLLTFLQPLQPKNSITYTALFMAYYKTYGMSVLRRYRAKDYGGNQALAASVAFGHEQNVCPNRWLEQTLANYGKNVFSYHFQYFYPCLDMLSQAILKGEERNEFNKEFAAHGAQQPFIFQKAGFNALIGRNCTFDSEEIQFSNNIQQFYTNFVKTGNPNGVNTAAKWPQYSQLRNYPHMVMGPSDERFSIKNNLKKEECDFWDKVLEQNTDHHYNNEEVFNRFIHADNQQID